MTYEEKLEIADMYLESKIGLSWNDLSDINSLHDAETKEEIIDMCIDRLEEENLYEHD